MNARTVALALILAAAPAWATKPTAERPRIDVVFCIDTTGSMQPYIDAVKKKVWDIANEMLKGKPAPIVRLGVVAYRDVKEKYLTQSIDLTEDIDKVHTYLMSLKADGGGDHPEHVTAGLKDALEKMQWSSGGKVLKAIYLVGDAPAHVDYADGDYKPIAKAAVAKGINIHTIACTGQAEVEQWKEIAKLADGQFIQMPTVVAMRGRGRMAPGGPHPAAAEKMSMEAVEGAAAPAAAAPAMDESMGDSIIKSLKEEAKKRGVSEY